MMVDHADHLVQAMVRLGREQEAANDLRSVLAFYDPLKTLGLKVDRAEPVPEIQALAWVAQSSAATGRPHGAWSGDAARRADAALAANPADPALQAAAALLYGALPGRAKQAADLWQALAARFPDNTALRAKANQPAAGTVSASPSRHPH